ncbi:hypothetical protein FRC07_012460 [Ceratobasidium sp. 392]|nr:hypothetical protein FRC07_012460 [Ceratobasidium sp. 392]
MSHHVYNVNRRAEIARQKRELEALEQARGPEENMDEDWDYGEGTSAQGALGQWATAQERTPTPVPPAPAPAFDKCERLPDGSIHQHFPIPEVGTPISDE